LRQKVVYEIQTHFSTEKICPGNRALYEHSVEK